MIPRHLFLLTVLSLLMVGCTRDIVPPIQKVAYELHYTGHVACGTGKAERWEEKATCTVHQSGYVQFCRIEYVSCNDAVPPMANDSNMNPSNN